MLSPTDRNRALDLLDKLKPIPEAVESLTREIRESFPVEGEPWPGKACPVDSVSLMVRDAQAKLESLLNPKWDHWGTFLETVNKHAKTPPDVDPGKAWEGYVRFRVFALAPPPINWRKLNARLETITYNHFLIADHYGWKEWLLGDRRSPLPWAWPDVSPIPPSMIQALDRSAELLKNVIEEMLKPLQVEAKDAPDNAVEKESPPGTGDPRLTFKLNDTHRKMLKLCKNKGHTGERLANKLGLSHDHVRRECGKLVKARWLANDKTEGYITVGAPHDATCGATD